jgi:paraquat-inducible protein B
MAGFFILSLDTTPPEIDIYAPNYTTTTSEFEVVVKADEILSSGFQEFYIVDQQGTRHDYDFTYQNNQFVGKITLSAFDNGLVTFYAQVKDEVNNLSALATKSIQIIPSVNYLRLSIDDSINIKEFGLSNTTRSIDSNIKEMENNFTVSTRQRDINVSNNERELTVGSQSDGTEISTEVVK